MKPVAYLSSEEKEALNNGCDAIVYPFDDMDGLTPLVECTPALQELVEAACEWERLLEKVDELCSGGMHLVSDDDTTFEDLDKSAMRLRKAAKAFKEASK